MAGTVTAEIELSEEVRAGLEEGRALVALETSVLSHGLPEDHARKAAEAMEAAVRGNGAAPAWVWTEGGKLRVGAGPEDLDRLFSDDVAKVARRDLPPVIAGKHLGGTTVSATLWAAGRTGIEVVATGGIGGVHPGTGDVSADLLELARTPGTLVCSGPKSILDPAATLERLEELGVGVVGYRCDRLPFFVVRETSLSLEHRVDDPAEAAAASRARRDLGVEAALLVCNPCPEDAALLPDEVAAAVDRCRWRAEADEVTGNALTPYLLRCLGEETQGRSIEANLVLLEANAGLAAQIAARL